MKPISILILCLACLCVKGGILIETNGAYFFKNSDGSLHYISSNPHETDAAKRGYATNSDSTMEQFKEMMTRTNTDWYTNLLATNLVNLAFSVALSTCTTNYGPWDTTNFVIDGGFKGTIQVGTNFYRITSKTNITSKIITVTNITKELTK